MRCRADRLILRPRCPGQRDAGVGTTPGAEGDGGAKAGAALSGPRRPGPQSSRSVRFRAEIGRVPRRDRFDGGAPGGRGREAGISARVRRRRRRTRAEMSTSTGARPCAGGFPHERRTARPARARPAPRGRTRRRTVVPRSTGSYPMPRGRTLKPPYSTTRRRSVRPRAFMYDRANPGRTVRVMTTRAVRSLRPHEPGYDRPEAMATGPVGRTTTRATAPPHDPPTAPDPTRPITPTPRPRPPTPTASRTARPSDNHHRPPITTGPVANRLTAQPRQPNRSRAGTRPNSSRNRTDLDEGGRVGRARCQASLTSSSMSSTLFMSRKRDTC